MYKRGYESHVKPVNNSYLYHFSVEIIIPYLLSIISIYFIYLSNKSVFQLALFFIPLPRILLAVHIYHLANPCVKVTHNHFEYLYIKSFIQLVGPCEKPHLKQLPSDGFSRLKSLKKNILQTCRNLYINFNIE